MRHTKYKLYKYLVVFGLILILSSCSASRNYQTPNLDVDESFRFSELKTSNSSMPGDSLQYLGEMPWREFFQDTLLIDLIEKGIKNNWDMKEAVLNIDVANQMLLRAKAERLPELNANLGSFVREYHSENYYSNPSGNYYGDKAAPKNLYTNKLRHTSDLQFSWELDVWGKMKNKKEAELASYLQTQEAKKAIQTELVAEIAKSYYHLLELDAQLNVAETNAKLNDSILRIIELQYVAGEVTSLAREQTEAQKLMSESLIPQLEKNIAIVENRLNFILGNKPGEIQRQNTEWNTDAEDSLAIGVPLRLLQNRPDIYAAELELRRANAEVGVAQAYRYPSLNIDLKGGLDAMLVENWFSIPGSVFGMITAGITQPIFNKRKFKTNFEVAKIEREKKEIGFQKILYLGITEVSDALITLDKIEEQIGFVDRRVEITQKTVSNSFMLFKSGLANYLEVLTAQSNAMNSELDRVNLELQKRNERVNLYRALGGGWD